MERGSSAPWSQILQETIGEGRLNGEALRDYFRPLEDWLRSENLRTGEYLGWSYDGDYCKFRYGDQISINWFLNVTMMRTF